MLWGSSLGGDFALSVAKQLCRGLVRRLPTEANLARIRNRRKVRAPGLGCTRAAQSSSLRGGGVRVVPVLIWLEWQAAAFLAPPAPPPVPMSCHAEVGGLRSSRFLSSPRSHKFSERPQQGDGPVGTSLWLADEADACRAHTDEVRQNSSGTTMRRAFVRRKHGLGSEAIVNDLCRLRMLPDI